ncbi:MAG: helix-turn-helix domain-containing protein [Prosthecobacter sp.]|uniref:helix-turn-helix domain-containing protein n=1 Tax=Prosthecobacter sp. TaxID=1965333 RepID=UPI0026155BEE|nr:helix-turn-helix domain-containing protein [Prosthecobacter sp.]MCF7789462.1 helix-turn-helix domain-containing protein [Prosthecobacter sp.]
MKPSLPTSNPQQSAEQSLWSTADVAKFLRCSERQVFSLRHKGLPSIQVGGLVRFDHTQVREWLSAGQEERAQQLADIAAHGDEDNAEVAAADLAREFPQVAVRI